MSNHSIVLSINGESFPVHVKTDDTLLSILREKTGLTGAKPGCLNGDCGACTVHIDGQAMKSCLMLAVEAENLEITTIEGLENSPMQEAFIEHFAFQCGYCTPGFIMNCEALLQAEPNATDQTIQAWLSSNICRCTGYKEIEAAVKSALTNQKTSPN